MVCRSASFRRYFLDSSLIPRVQEPAAICLRHRVFQTPISYHTIVFSDTTHNWKIRLEDENLNSRGL